MVTFLVNGVLVGACLLALENIFLTNNKVERLKANIRDYLENLTPLRTREVKECGPVRRNAREGTEKIAKPCNLNEEKESAATLAYNPRDENQEASGEELNRFLREFFGTCETKSS